MEAYLDAIKARNKALAAYECTPSSFNLDRLKVAQTRVARLRIKLSSKRLFYQRKAREGQPQAQKMLNKLDRVLAIRAETAQDCSHCGEEAIFQDGQGTILCSIECKRAFY